MPNTLSLEPLADYLQPQFGNIYDFKPINADGPEIQAWTDELRAAVKQYLLHVGPPELVESAFGISPDEAPDELLQEVLSSYQPSVVAHALHLATVRSMSLDQLIGHLDSWPSEDERWDTEHWLEETISWPQLQQLGDEAGQRVLEFDSTTVKRIVDALQPPALLKAWHDITTPAPSDLTDAEWDLIKPFVPTHGAAGTSKHRERTRLALSGMLYWSAEGCSWSYVPSRYGLGRVIYHRHRVYKRSGIFARMLKELQGNPDAVRLVEWLTEQVS